ncbi:MAG TPA: DUF3565 domain-containing protein [Nevskiaceae bacterium]|nr:DUF3565 domain-containing protein [Nevskiaceae bacterium]
MAELECGHRQHVRHQPPGINRPWVTTPRCTRPHPVIARRHPAHRSLGRSRAFPRAGWFIAATHWRDLIPAPSCSTWKEAARMHRCSICSAPTSREPGRGCWRRAASWLRKMRRCRAAIWKTCSAWCSTSAPRIPAPGDSMRPRRRRFFGPTAHRLLML